MGVLSRSSVPKVSFLGLSWVTYLLMSWMKREEADYQIHIQQPGWEGKELLHWMT